MITHGMGWAITGPAPAAPPPAAPPTSGYATLLKPGTLAAFKHIFGSSAAPGAAAAAAPAASKLPWIAAGVLVAGAGGVYLWRRRRHRRAA